MNFAVRIHLSVLLVVFHHAAIAQDSIPGPEPLAWIYTWSSDDALDDSVGDDTDILYAIFDRESNTWSSPYPLNTDAETDTDSDYAPQLLTDSGGNRFVLWMSGPATARTVQRARYDEEMDIWTDPVQVGDTFEADHIPQISVDSLGNMMMVWSSRNTLSDTIGSDADILYSSYNPLIGSWSEPAPIDDDALTDGDLDHDDYPQILADGSGRWIASWDQLHHRGARISRYDPAAGIWSPMSTPIGRGESPDFSLGADGKMMVVWQTGDNWGFGVDLLFSIYDTWTDTWTDPGQLNADTSEGGEIEAHEIPLVSFDGHDKWMVVWRSHVIPDHLYVHSRIYDQTTETWSTEQRWGHQHPGVRLIGDGQGNWLNIWHRSTGVSPHGQLIDWVLESAVYNESSTEWTETMRVLTDYVPREDVPTEDGEIGTHEETIYVDFDYPSSNVADETGQSTETPFNNLFEAFNYVKQDGTGVIQIESGESSEVFTDSDVLDPPNKITLNANNGPVRIGVQEPQALVRNTPSGFVTRDAAKP